MTIASFRIPALLGTAMLLVAAALLVSISERQLGGIRIRCEQPRNVAAQTGAGNKGRDGCRRCRRRQRPVDAGAGGNGRAGRTCLLDGG